MNNLLFILLLLIACDNPIESSCGDSFSFMLEDLNPSSSTYGTQVGPDSWENQIRLFYFSNNEM